MERPPVDAIADTVGGETVARLGPGGVLGSVVGAPPGVKEHITVRAIQTHSDARRLVELAEDVARGKLLLPIAGRFPLAQIRDAFRRAGQGGGKVLVTASL